MNDLLVSIEELRHKIDDIENIVRKEIKKSEPNHYEMVTSFTKYEPLIYEYKLLCSRIVKELYHCPICLVPLDGNGPDNYLCPNCFELWDKNSGLPGKG